MKTSSRGGSGSNQIAVYRNAFSTATTNPKIPDGKAFHSSGVRLQAVKEWVNNTDSSMEFLLFPGINNGLIVAKTGNIANGRYQPYPSHASHTTTGGENEAAQNPETAIDKWRVVSQALKVTLLNNSDENDGWWEAARVQLSSSSGFRLTSTGNGLIVGTSANVGLDALPGVDVERQMVENPTYVTGKLRDIHRHTFQLLPQGNDHDFNELRTTVPLEANANELNLIDRAFDAIHLRIHGRTGLETPTRIMTHIVSNQEIVYDEAATLVRYHSETVMTPNFQIMKRKAVTGSSKASKRNKYSTS